MLEGGGGINGSMPGTGLVGDVSLLVALARWRRPHGAATSTITLNPP